ncbi:MAG: leucine-rich repeat domain-containing protein [Lentimicrobium sp.]|nr:leucine-rich repeat domain-containing protein [Lentimicrobium sp.]
MIDSVILPNNIDSIGYGAFSQNLIRNIELPTNLMVISKNAFTDNKLSELNIPSKVNYIGFGAFGNNLLEEVNFEAGDLDTIEGRAFCNNQIQEIEIPCNVKYIGFEAFFRNKITNVILNQGELITVGESVFEENLIDSFILPEQNNLNGFNGWVDGNNNTISGPPYIASNLRTSYKAEFTTSIKNDFIEKFQIRPNPVKDKLYFDISNVHEIKELWLFNYNGVLLKNWKRLYQNQIDMSMLPMGLYYVKIEDRKGGQKTFKVIKE